MRSSTITSEASKIQKPVWIANDIMPLSPLIQSEKTTYGATEYSYMVPLYARWQEREK